MNFLNIHTDLLRSETYLGAEPLERATWLNLMGWCASQENGGVIQGASEWGDRKWNQLCGVTKEEATLVSELYHIDDDGNLVVNLYPVEKEEEVKCKRAVAKANGKKGGRPSNKTEAKPTSDTIQKAEGNGMEGNEREGSENKTASPPSSIFEVFPTAAAAFSKHEKAALAEGSQAVLDELTDDDWLALYCWFVAADDKARGKALWPRSRSEFLACAGEAVEKIRIWWDKKGHRWWEKKNRPAKTEPAEQSPEDVIDGFREDYTVYCAEKGITTLIEEAFDNPTEWGKFTHWIMHPAA